MCNGAVLLLPLLYRIFVCYCEYRLVNKIVLTTHYSLSTMENSGNGLVPVLKQYTNQWGEHSCLRKKKLPLFDMSRSSTRDVFGTRTPWVVP